jgi:hypothetical protein
VRHLLLVLLVACAALAGGCRQRAGEELTVATARGEVSLQPLTEQIGAGDARIRCRVSNPDRWPAGALALVYHTGSRWSEVIMQPADSAAGEGLWEAALPERGKGHATRYYILIDVGEPAPHTLPAGAPDESLALTFKGVVSRPVLVAHVLFMMGGLLPILMGLIFAIAYLRSGRFLVTLRRLVFVGFVLLAIGSVPLGIAVEYQVFGTYWEGWPFGRDVTDTKSGVMLLLWLILLIARGRDLFSRRPAVRGLGDKAWARWVVAMTIFTVVLYLIPHENLKF